MKEIIEKFNQLAQEIQAKYPEAHVGLDIKDVPFESVQDPNLSDEERYDAESRQVTRHRSGFLLWDHDTKQSIWVRTQSQVVVDLGPIEAPNNVELSEQH